MTLVAVSGSHFRGSSPAGFCCGSSLVAVYRMMVSTTFCTRRSEPNSPIDRQMFEQKCCTDKNHRDIPDIWYHVTIVSIKSITYFPWNNLLPLYYFFNLYYQHSLKNSKQPLSINIWKCYSHSLFAKYFWIPFLCELTREMFLH